MGVENRHDREDRMHTGDTEELRALGDHSTVNFASGKYLDYYFVDNKG